MVWPFSKDAVVKISSYNRVTDVCGGIKKLHNMFIMDLAKMYA